MPDPDIEQTEEILGPPEEKEDRLTPEPQPLKKIFVSNAGLVLVAPFLPHFFRRLGLLGENEGKIFGGPLKRGRAVAASQLIAWPDLAEMAEGDLALNKLLCGWPPAEPLAVESFEDIEAARPEVKTLLKAVISQWQSLSTATPGGLVKHFLRRNGTLYLDGHPRLEVERQPHDLLLDTLPWVLSIVQTPWMERPMRVMWNE